MRKLLVTGGAGFIGSNFVRYALKKKYRVVNLDKLTYAGNLENLTDIENNKNYKFIKGDITDNKLVDEIVSDGIHSIINFAAETHVDRSIEEPTEFIKTNIVGTQTLLESAKKFKIKKFIQISTDEVYGSIIKGSANEESQLAPNSPYASSKASADLFCRAYFKTYNLPVVITRCSNNFGEYQFPEKLIPLMIINALNNKSLPVYGDGGNIRDWIYVGDHVRAIELVLQNGIPGEIYNISAGNEIKNIDIVKLILKELKISEKLITFVKDRPGHDRRYSIDSTKIRKKLGFKPKYSFSEALKKTISWYVNNQQWWKKIIQGEYREYYKRMYENR